MCIFAFINNTRVAHRLANICTYGYISVSYTHLRAHETEADLVCRLLLEKNFF